LAAVAGVLLQAPAHANSIAFTFQDPPVGTISTQGNDGFRFQPNSDIRVTALGYYDRDQDGLALTHAVGIFDVATQTLLASTNVGPGAALDGLFRYSPIVALYLTAGQSYMVVGFHPGSATDDLAAQNPAGFAIAPELTYGGYFLNFDPNLSFVDTADNTQFFGPNFQFEVPEPGSGACIVLAALVALGLRMKASNRAPG
jgi:hypothetical protein